MKERGGKERATPTFLMKIAIPAYSNEVTINRTKPVIYTHVHHAHIRIKWQISQVEMSLMSFVMLEMI